MLQVLLSLIDPEQFPPFCSALVLIRDLVSIPPPQVFEQDNQVDQGPQTQSSGKKNKYLKLNNHNLKWWNDPKNECYTFYLHCNPLQGKYRVNQQCCPGGNCSETPRRPSVGVSGGLRIFLAKSLVILPIYTKFKLELASDKLKFHVYSWNYQWFS